MNFKKILKKVLVNFLFKLKILEFLHYKNRHKICVLMLHGVMAEKKKSVWSPLRPQLEPKELERSLRLLSESYQFITTDQAVAMLQGKEPFIDNPLLMTFDDGYRNNIDYALPICKQFGIKPILFIATDHVENCLPFWFDRLDYALQQNMGEVISITYSGQNYSFDATSRATLSNSYKQFRDKVKSKYSDDIAMNKLFDALSDQLELRSGKALRDICNEDDWSAIVSWGALRKEVKLKTLDVGSHTINHLRLDSLSEDKAYFELQESKRLIEDKLSVDCDYFCYPNGNYNKQSISLVKSSGYKAAFSTDVGLCQSKDQIMALKRFNFPSHKTKAELMYLFNFRS
jgi:peptidoglycan/xylan/chitin deacetylase (PgdA/CDA1 family)